MVPTCSCAASLPERTLRRHHPRQEPSAVVPHAGICAGGPEWTVPTGILSFTVCSGASLKSDTAAKDAEIRVLRHYVESIAEPTRSSCDGAT